jgi:GNAT superfamily N-acetyltransferase
MGLIRLAEDEIATVVTSLAMDEPPPRRPVPPSPLLLRTWRRPEPEKYRALFARVGAPWLWYSRLAMDDAALSAIIHDQNVDVLVVQDTRGIELGLLELDFREPGSCELSYFALVPELTGKGHGRWLMNHALMRGWRRDIRRVWVHTCTLDHPSALGFYRRMGFVPFARAVETFPDPRLRGLLPRDAAPQVPLLDRASRR